MVASTGEAKAGDWPDALHRHNGAGAMDSGWRSTLQRGDAIVGAIGLLPRGAAK